jgi:GT2 family glycosyltransferase
MNEILPKVGIALLNWNGYEDTALCLSSLRESHFRPAVILVHDNGSVDGSAERLKAEFPEIELVLGGRNFGFSEGNNRAVKILMDAGMDYVWILNNDTKVPPDCLGRLVRTMEEDPGIGAASAKIWFMDDSRPIFYAGGTFNGWTFDTRFRGLKERDAGRYDVPEDTDNLTGCCMLIRREVIREIGLFNRAFFAYAEDIEWSLRAMEAGIRLRYEPRAVLWHRMLGASSKDRSRVFSKGSPRTEFLCSRNGFILVRLHSPPWSLRRGLALAYHVFIRRLPRGVGLILMTGRRMAGWAVFKGLWAGLWIRPDPADCRL